ncbi:TCP-1/cpn60 family chaperonin, putative [Eimeria tenella]|uniref:CCT-eta n=1 Tax=Eimeria tenella TaxID=5802 RepID=U6L6H8_EIMTE|nr:TCP-1/cpn60 family chaperonin, putative [Eimeria tenella]CDJ44194.1 TCP-1/cpn60 family chaperonin, putative [Eimeria tenella]|eukprot:XP_013234943.1 TCP-1/cpn60 family chaperonin, putative [Eimeria tenella]
MSHMLHAPIILLKEGADTSQGRSQIISNINACQVIVDIVRSTLGPRGMDKLIEGEHGVATVTNDGATVLKLLQVKHPAAALLVDVAQSQDLEVGDGTTSVVVLAGELLQEAKTFIEDGMAPQVIVKGFRAARDLLVVDAVELVGPEGSRELLGVKKEGGGSLGDSKLVKGVIFKKTFSYAGFELQPKQQQSPKVLLLNLELELKAEKENAEIRVDNPEDYQSLIDAEWDIIYEKLQAIVDSGATVVFSKLPIGDLATQFFADREVFCAGRVEEADLERAAKATGAKIQSTVYGLSPDVLGSCGRFEEVQVGSERYNLLSECPGAQSATLLLRGGAPQFLEEAERSLNDAIMVVRRAAKTHNVVGGGGAIEMALSRHIRDISRGISGKQQLVFRSFAKALEAIPKALTRNAGFDCTDTLNRLRQKHAAASNEVCWMGVDCVGGGIVDSMAAHVWEPAAVKQHAIAAATEAACLLLSIDETITQPNPQERKGGPH